jgi:quercetin dioxygenase-like cupin family protein
LSERDLLNFAVGESEDASSLRENLHNTSDQFWAVLSQDGVFSDWHRDKGGCATWTCQSQGRKLWFWRNGDKIHCILVSAGDLIILPPGLEHAVVTIGHGLGFGGHFYYWETLADSLHHARLCERDPNLTNDEPGMTIKYIARLIRVFDHVWSL